MGGLFDFPTDVANYYQCISPVVYRISTNTTRKLYCNNIILLDQDNMLATLINVKSRILESMKQALSIYANKVLCQQFRIIKFTTLWLLHTLSSIAAN